jgi:hypothetical protein
VTTDVMITETDDVALDLLQHDMYGSRSVPQQGEPAEPYHQEDFIAWLEAHRDDIVGYARSGDSCPIFCWLAFGRGRLDLRGVGRAQVRFAPLVTDSWDDMAEVSYCGLPWMTEAIIRLDRWAWDTHVELHSFEYAAGKMPWGAVYYPAVTGAQVLAVCFER